MKKNKPLSTLEKRRETQAGLNVIGLVIAAAIATMTALLFSEVKIRATRSMINVQMILARDSVASLLDRISHDKRSLERAANFAGANSAGNTAFQYCYMGTASLSPTPACAPKCCVETISGQPQPFNLLDPGDPSGNQLVSGTLASTAYPGQDTTHAPAHFGLDGAPCNAPGPACPIEVFSSFTASCSGATPCTKPAGMKITYTVRQATDPITGITLPLATGLTSLKPLSKTVVVFSRSAPLPVDQVSVGARHVCAISRGQVWCWGKNLDGQLGDGTTINRVNPVRVIGIPGEVQKVASGENHTCALSNGSVWCWGKNTDGTLGNGSNVSSAIPVAVLGLNSQVTDLNGRVFHSCALKTANVWCWGKNDFGQLGNNSTIDSNVPVIVKDSSGTTDLTNITAIATSDRNTCAMSAGEAQCWGGNSAGQLGIGTTTDSLLPVSVRNSTNTANLGGLFSISTTHLSMCANVGGSVWCWGDGSRGGLGNGLGTSSSLPVQVTGITGTQVMKTADFKGCAIASGQVWCWGKNDHGQIGDNTFTDRLSPVQTLNPSGAGPFIGVQDLDSNDFVTCAIKDSKLYCWGDNTFGQLGNGTKADNPLPSLVELPAS